MTLYRIYYSLGISNDSTKGWGNISVGGGGGGQVGGGGKSG